MSDSKIFIGAAQSERMVTMCAIRHTANRYLVLSWREVADVGLDVALEAMRRDLAAVLSPEPEPPFVYAHETRMNADNSREWREQVAVREQREAAAAVARDARLDAIGATYVAKTDGCGELSLSRSWALMQSGRLTGVGDAQTPLEWVRNSIIAGTSAGPLGLALSRAIEAADTG